jgi:hypothetical protein
MKPIDLYRKALRSGRIEMMQEVIVRLSHLNDTEYLVDSLVNRVQLLTEDRTPQELMRKLMKGQY